MADVRFVTTVVAFAEALIPGTASGTAHFQAWPMHVPRRTGFVSSLDLSTRAWIANSAGVRG